MWLLILLSPLVYIFSLLFLRTQKNQPAGPKPLPFIGNLHLLLSRSFRSVTEASYKTHVRLSNEWRDSGYFVFYNGTTPLVIMFEQKEIENVWKNSEDFARGTEYTVLRKSIGDGILNSEGQKWKTRRKLHNFAFSSTALRSLTPMIIERAKAFLKDVEAEKSNGLVNINSLVQKFVLTTALKCFFDFNASENLNDLPILEPMKTLSRMIMETIVNPLYKINFIHDLTAHGRKMRHYSKVSFEFVRQMVSKREESANEEKGRQTLLDHLLKAEADGLITREGILEEVMTLLFASHDTSVFATTIALHLLANHQSVQDKVKEEVGNVIGLESDNDINHDQLNRLVYTEAVVKEALRMYTPTVFSPRIATREVVFKGHKFSKGTTFSMMQGGMSRNPAYFEEPEKFKPERFVDENGDPKTVKNYVPFGVGARSCIGQRFALNHIKLLLAYILRHYKRLEALEKTEDLFIEMNFTLKAESDVMVKFIS